jgi:primosomal protein N'
VRILVTSEDENLAKHLTKVYYDSVRALQSENPDDFLYLGVMKSPIGRIQNKYRLQVLMRLKPDNADFITDKLFEIADNIKCPNATLFVEINPQNLS